jgi:hypothetical protein
MKWSVGPSVRALVAFVVLAGVAGRTNQVSAQQSGLPTPESVLGFPVGADFKLATYEQSIAYFKALAAASDKLQLLDVGTTSFGRTWYLAVISSPENLADLEHYRAIAQRLAHPEGLTDDSARALAREGRRTTCCPGRTTRK